MNIKPAAIVGVLVLSSVAVLGTGCASEVEEPEPSAQSEDEVAVAVPIVACLADPPCAALVAAAVGYAVYQVSQLSGEALRTAQRVADNYFAARRGASCTAHCSLVLANSAGGVGSGGQCEGFVTGTGGSRQDAQRDANSRVPRGCRLKHCTFRCQ